MILRPRGASCTFARRPSKKMVKLRLQMLEINIILLTLKVNVGVWRLLAVHFGLWKKAPHSDSSKDRAKTEGDVKRQHDEVEAKLHI
jgi:hypothetical protein